jgi:hypothetical protein
MFERLKNILVSSYIGTIALGWIFAQGILHFAYIFSAPVVGWMTRREYRGLMEHGTVTGFTLRDSLPELVKSLSLLVIGYFLLRLLYFGPPDKQKIAETSLEHKTDPS